MGNGSSGGVRGAPLLWLKAAAFTILVPGVVAVLIPFLLSRSYTSSMELGELNVVGVPFLLAGIILYLTSLTAFVVRGGGTPAAWFAVVFAPLIGREPGRMVSGGLYRMSRNPMYLGVVLAVFGQGLLFDYLAYHFYACILWLFFHIVVTVLEEPHLKRKFGAEYETYLKTTPRWIGFGPDPPEKQKKS